MSVKIKIYSDYVCPFCLLAENPLEQAIHGKEVEVEWMPYELRPSPQQTLRPEGDYLQSTWKQSVYPMAERMGVPMTLPRVSPQPYTHLAFEGYQYAKENGKANEYNARMFRAFFQEERDIGDIEVLTELAGDIGLDQAAYKETLETGKYKEAHRKALEQAYRENITSVPTFVIGGTTVAGVRSKETLEQFINDEIEKQKSNRFPEGLSCGIDGCN